MIKKIFISLLVGIVIYGSFVWIKSIGGITNVYAYLKIQILLRNNTENDRIIYPTIQNCPYYDTLFFILFDFGSHKGSSPAHLPTQHTKELEKIVLQGYAFLIQNIMEYCNVPLIHSFEIGGISYKIPALYTTEQGVIPQSCGYMSIYDSDQQYTCAVYKKDEKGSSVIIPDIPIHKSSIKIISGNNLLASGDGFGDGCGWGGTLKVFDKDFSFVRSLLLSHSACDDEIETFTKELGSNRYSLNTLSYFDPESTSKKTKDLIYLEKDMKLVYVLLFGSGKQVVMDKEATILDATGFILKVDGNPIRYSFDQIDAMYNERSGDVRFGNLPRVTTNKGDLGIDFGSLYGITGSVYIESCNNKMQIFTGFDGNNSSVMSTYVEGKKYHNVCNSPYYFVNKTPQGNIHSYLFDILR